MLKHTCGVPAKGVVSCFPNKQIRGVRSFVATSTTNRIEDFSSRIEALRLRVLDIFKSVDRIYIDTCSLMRDCFVAMLGVFGEDLKREKITFEIFPQVVNELKGLTLSNDAEVRMMATRALTLMSSVQNRSLFVLAQTDMDFPLADRVICREMFNRSFFDKQILITQDGKLAAGVFNFCCAHPNNHTAVYRLNKHGFLAGYISDLMELAPHISLPEGYNEGLTLAPSSPIVQTYTTNTPLAVMLSSAMAKNCSKVKTDEKQIKRSIFEYTHDAIVNGINYMSRDALVHIFAQNGNPAFLARLQELHTLGHPVRINILSSSLTKWLRERIAPWKHLFQIIEPANSRMSEEDAILAAMCTECISTEGKHQLLISKEATLYNRIAKRTPKCYHFIEIWGTCLSDTGLLLDARRIKKTDNIADSEYNTVVQNIA